MEGDRPIRQPVHGVLLLDKPVGLSSHTALARAKRALSAAKAGHTGTLDPLASGLLPLCFGEATKFAADLLEADKTYAAVLRLGIVTSTGDREGEVLETHPVSVGHDQIDAVLDRFLGPLDQVPPMHSALKVDGRPLYERARRGEVVERAARRVTIKSLAKRVIGAEHVSFEVTVSKGTYIRVLAEDIGRALGCGAHLSDLRRLKVGALDLADAISLEALQAAGVEAARARLLALDTLVQSLEPLELDAPAARRFQQGQRLAMDGAPGRLRVYAGGDTAPVFLGVGERRDGVLSPLRLLAEIPTGATAASQTA